MLQPPLPCYFSFYCSLAATGKLGVLGFQGYLLPLHSRLGSRHLRCIYLFEASNHFRSDEVVQGGLDPATGSAILTFICSEVWIADGTLYMIAVYWRLRIGFVGPEWLRVGSGPASRTATANA